MEHEGHEGTVQEFARMMPYDRERVAFYALAESDTTFEALTGEPPWIDRVGGAWSRARRKVLRWYVRQLPECQACGDTTGS